MSSFVRSDPNGRSGCSSDDFYSSSSFSFSTNRSDFEDEDDHEDVQAAFADFPGSLGNARRTFFASLDWWAVEQAQNLLVRAGERELVQPRQRTPTAMLDGPGLAVREFGA